MSQDELQTSAIAPVKVEKSFDFSAVAGNDTAEVELEIEGVGTDVWFEMLGPSHEVRRQFDIEHDRKDTERARKSPAKILHKYLPDPERQEEVNVDRLVKCTVGWRTGQKRGLIILNDQEIPFSPAEARKLYENPKFWFVKNFYHGKLNSADVFIKSSSVK